MDLGPPPYEPKSSPVKPVTKLPWLPLVVSLIITILSATCCILLYQNLQLTAQIKQLTHPEVTPTPLPSVTPTPPGTTMCGGIAGKTCPAGQMCQMSANYPDASGTCINEPALSCPSNGYVDCMPNPNAGVRYECTPEAFTWYKTNCKNFKGGAL
jgi:hypothetical protein